MEKTRDCNGITTMMMITFLLAIVDFVMVVPFNLLLEKKLT